MDPNTDHQNNNENHMGQEDTLNAAYEDLTKENNELRETLLYLEKENSLYKKKYNDLILQLNNLNDLIEKNARVFQELYDDSKCALEMGRVAILSGSTQGPIPQRKKSVISTHTLKAESLKVLSPGQVAVNDNSSKTVARRKIHIEPINLQELKDCNNESQSMKENVHVNTPSTSLGDRLSVIIEESLDSNSRRENNICDFTSPRNSLNNLNDIKEVVIEVNKLPADIVSYYMKKRDKSRENSKDNSFFNITDSLSITQGPSFSSTPLKLETMRLLGLVPAVNKSPVTVPNFVNIRRKIAGNGNDTGTRGLVAEPKKEKISTSLTKRRITSLEVSASLGESRKRRNICQSPEFGNKRTRSNIVEKTENSRSSIVEKETKQERTKTKQKNKTSPENKVKRRTSRKGKVPNTRTSCRIKLENQTSPLVNIKQSPEKGNHVRRPTRTVKPRSLAEPSLRKKMRRS